MGATRPRPPVISDAPPGAGKGVAKFRHHMSEEGKQRLSEIATQRHREGGFRPNPTQPRRRRPNKRRVSEKVAKAAREKKNAERIIDVFKDAVAPSQPIMIRLKAAQAWVDLDLKDARQAIREDAEEGQRMDRETLLSLLSEKLTAGHTAALIRKQVESETGDGVVDLSSDAVEDID